MSENESLNFLEQIVEQDLENNVHGGRVATRFPPEPNGYLHLGHAKAICLNFGLADKYKGTTNLRFDDTNPSTEETEYVDAIKEDIRWLGFDWEHEFYASDYFDQLYAFAEQLILQGDAFVDDSNPEQIAAGKGSPTVPGDNSPFRERSIDENLDLFRRMKAGEFAEGSKVLRAKIDMSLPNMLMRDPVIYRIKFAHHHRTGDQWCIYPMYDFAHGQSDSIERITHSICTLEFIHHRPLYDWFIQKLGIFPSHQYEFARLNLNYTVMSKRRLLQLVQEGYVDGWDDPRMPTISGLRRRGFTPASIRDFASRVGIAKRENVIDIGLLEFCVREDLNKIALRKMVVLDPLLVTITNWPEGHTEWLEAENNPEDSTAGERNLPLTGQFYIERDDFMEIPEKKYFRLIPEGMVRLKHGYIIKCDEVIKDGDGQLSELKVTYYPNSRSGSDTSSLQVKSTIHWVDATHAEDMEVRIYDRLFKVENPMSEDNDFKTYINENSLQVIQNAKAEQSISKLKPGEHCQFLRKGYFTVDKNSTAAHITFNRTVGLKDNWKKN
ncbi:MAG TPA: glutamine--tRNA ligase/YqeY domain fusion protein [Saprospiraceae bacterium]|nr:glutamine--tRNA ligase/YqeY domain fusion protein [Saprospiraceae bacterium]